MTAKIYIDKIITQPFIWHKFEHSWDKGGTPLLSISKVGFWIFTRYKWVAISGARLYKVGYAKSLNDAKKSSEDFAKSVNPNYPYR